jgi:hypothetical protein
VARTRLVSDRRDPENPEYWNRLKSPFDRVAFIQRLNDLRLIRNNIMHFNPEPLDPQTIPKLRNMLRVLRAFEDQ